MRQSATPGSYPVSSSLTIIAAASDPAAIAVATCGARPVTSPAALLGQHGERMHLHDH